MKGFSKPRDGTLRSTLLTIAFLPSLRKCRPLAAPRHVTRTDRCGAPAPARDDHRGCGAIRIFESRDIRAEHDTSDDAVVQRLAPSARAGWILARGPPAGPRRLGTRTGMARATPMLWGSLLHGRCRRAVGTAKERPDQAPAGRELPAPESVDTQIAQSVVVNAEVMRQFVPHDASHGLPQGSRRARPGEDRHSVDADTVRSDLAVATAPA